MEETSLDELDWDKLGPVDAYGAERLEWVVNKLESGGELSGDLSWKSTLFETEEADVTVEEVLGALGEARHMMYGYRTDLGVGREDSDPGEGGR